MAIILKYWWIGLIALGLVTAGFVIRSCSIPQPKPVDNTSTNQGNKIPVNPVGTYTNGITNYVTLTNVYELFIANSNFDVDPFIFHQVDDSLTVDLYTREGKTTLKSWLAENPFFLGGGANFSPYGVSPEIVEGYEREDWGVFGHETIFSTNYNFGVAGFYRFNFPKWLTGAK
jgi:hypothetical protein